MGFLQTVAADIEAVWQNDIEPVAVEVESVIATGLKDLLTVIGPSAWAELITLGKDLVADFVADPADPSAVITEFLNQAEVSLGAWWAATAPTIQTALAQTATSIGTISAAAVAPAATTAPSSGGTGATGAAS
jgi:hypothetical protein